MPWTGFPAKFLRTVSFHRPSEAPGQLKPWYPFPYFEAFRLEEATNELAFVTVGMYGHELPKQNGLPISLRMPWKYGFKSPKGIVKFEFVESQPPAFWNSLQPTEYGFLSNVNPDVPHPPWSQAKEKFFGPSGVELRPALPYNGYAEFVASMYSEETCKRIS